jgi:type II secretory ATPase GspE/PulE/Tfp pilus assembly ATPase PilB-like protein
VICDKCKEKVRLSSEVIKELGVSEKDAASATIYMGRGCEACKHTGYKGRTAIYEMLLVTEPIRQLVLKRVSADQIKKKALQLGMRTLRQDGWEKIARGITTPAEVLRVTQEEELVE